MRTVRTVRTVKTTGWFFGVGGVLGIAMMFAACSDDPATTPDTSADTADVSETGPDADAAEEVTMPDTTEEVAPEVVEPRCEYSEPLCSDEQIAMLQFSKRVDGGDIVEEGTVEGEFRSHIDATAGGFNGTLGYTYARFTPEGLVTVDVSDEDALESMGWDIAFRRFIARLNSGVSGPSCVLGGRTAPGTTFEGLTSVPGSLTFRAEQYFTADGCEYVPETSGIGSPLTILSSYWNYSGCVKMSGNIYVLKLRDGRHVKAQFLSYYSPTVQATCDASGSAPSPNGAGNIRLRWAFID